jgi:hypothetical protein
MKQTGLSPFEVLYGCPFPLNQRYTRDLKKIGHLTLREQMKAFRVTLSKINVWVWERLPISLTTPQHPYKPGDAIWVKEQNVQPLKPHWGGPFVVILSTPHCSYSSRDCSLGPPQPDKTSFSQIGMHPRSNLTVQGHPLKCHAPPQQFPPESPANSWGQVDSLALVTLEAD